jgi:hypothetical protein
MNDVSPQASPTDRLFDGNAAAFQAFVTQMKIQNNMGAIGPSPQLLDTAWARHSGGRLA